MRITYGLRQRAPITLVLGRKSQQFKRDIRRVVKSVSLEALDIAVFFCPVKTGFSQRHLRVAYTPAGFGFDLGWRAIDYRRAGKVFYPPFFVEGTSRQRAQDPLRPAFRMTRPRLERQCARVLVAWAKKAA